MSVASLKRARPGPFPDLADRLCGLGFLRQLSWGRRWCGQSHGCKELLNTLLAAFPRGSGFHNWFYGLCVLDSFIL